jgi:hypothetical protein
MKFSKIFKTAVTMAMIGGMALVMSASAGAEPKMGHDHMGEGHSDRTLTCTGTFASPGVLAGWYGNVVVNGVCTVNGGPTVVFGDLTVSPGSTLDAAFALNDGGSGVSSLTVRGNVNVLQGASALIGCEPNHFVCQDDPNQTTGTLTGQDRISGDVREIQPLGVVVHTTTIGGDVSEYGGGGGLTCTPPAGSVFASFGSPVYSDYEDNTIGGDLSVVGLQTCWLGSLRDTVGGSVTDINNTMADPDAGEVLQNTIGRNIVCFGNSPAVQFGDSGATPNVVDGQAFGQCGFNVLQPNPAPTATNPAGPLTPISVKGTSSHGDDDGS